MGKPSRHLHRDYHTTWCGKDASHILMTYDADEATCKKCKAASDAQKALDELVDSIRAEGRP